MPDTLTDEEPMPKASGKKWYTGGDEVDAYCREHFASAVEATSSLSADDLAALVGSDRESALSLIVLLDQIPRNIYRGAEAKKAYTVTDPKARDLCKAFISPEKAFDRLDQWPNYWYPSFFYMPLMHSEDLEDHKLFQEKTAKALSASKSAAEQKAITTHREFDTSHAAVLERFGRYPSRNEAMGRESTAEESDFLKDGPGWGAK